MPATRTLTEVCEVVQEEAANLNPQRKLTCRFKELRQFMSSHPTLLHNMTYHAYNNPLVLLFLAGCQNSETTQVNCCQLVANAVFPDEPCIQAQQRIKHLVQKSYIFSIGEDYINTIATTDPETGTTRYNLSRVFVCEQEIDRSLVGQEAEQLFQEVEQLEFPSVEMAELVWWNLAPWMACVFGVCSAVDWSVSCEYPTVIELIRRITNGDFDEQYFSHLFNSHPFLRLFHGDKRT